MSTSTSRPRQRYGSNEGRSSTGGRDSRGTRGTVGGKVVAVLAILLVAGFLFFGTRAVMEKMNRPVSATFISQERIDDSTGRLWIEVDRKDPSVPSYCIVTAVDYQHAEVGRREVIIPAGGEELTQIAVEMPVRAPLVSGQVYGCSTTIPSYMDPESSFYQAR